MAAAAATVGAAAEKGRVVPQTDSVALHIVLLLVLVVERGDERVPGPGEAALRGTRLGGVVPEVVVVVAVKEEDEES